MPTSVRNITRLLVTALVTLANALSVDLGIVLRRLENSALDYPNIANGTTAGRLRTNAAAAYRIGGTLYTKASTDDLWNLSAETALTAGQFRAYWLYLNAAGTGSIASGTVASSLAAAVTALPAIDSTRSVIGCYVANPSTNFANALAAQGTIYNGFPAGYTVTNDTVTVISA